MQKDFFWVTTAALLAIVLGLHLSNHYFDWRYPPASATIDLIEAEQARYLALAAQWRLQADIEQRQTVAQADCRSRLGEALVHWTDEAHYTCLARRVRAKVYGHVDVASNTAN